MSDHNVTVRHIQTEGEDGVLDIDITRYHEKRTTGLVRIDSIGEKVFYLSMNSLNERLLNDFSLNIGDTIIYNEYSSNVFYSSHLEISDNMYSSDKDIVQSIDTLELGDFKLKRYNLNFGEYMEGIGSKLGIPYMGNGFVPVSFTYHLVYMEIEGERFNNERINFR